MSIKVLGGILDNLPRERVDPVTGDFLERVLNVIGPTTTFISVSILDRSLQHLKVIGSASRAGLADESAHYIAGEPIRLDRALMGLVVQVELGVKGRPEWIKQDALGYYKVQSVESAMREGSFIPTLPETKSVFLAPVRFGLSKTLVGVFAADSSEPRAFQAGPQTDFLHILALVLGHVLEGFYRSYHDPIIDLETKIYHRAYLYDFLTQQLGRLHESPQIHLIFIDLNNFSQVNEDFTHLGGDRVISFFGRVIDDAAEELREGLKSDVVCFHYGGDEFVLAVKGADGEQPVFFLEKVENKIRESVPELEADLRSNFETAKSLCLSFSAGISSTSEVDQFDLKGIDKLIKLADDAMWRVKTSRKVLLEQGQDVGSVYGLSGQPRLNSLKMRTS